MSLLASLAMLLTVAMQVAAQTSAVNFTTLTSSIIPDISTTPWAIAPYINSSNLVDSSSFTCYSSTNASLVAGQMAIDKVSAAILIVCNATSASYCVYGPSNATVTCANGMMVSTKVNYYSGNSLAVIFWPNDSVPNRLQAFEMDFKESYTSGSSVYAGMIPPAYAVFVATAQCAALGPNGQILYLSIPWNCSSIVKIPLFASGINQIGILPSLSTGNQYLIGNGSSVPVNQTAVFNSIAPLSITPWANLTATAATSHVIGINYTCYDANNVSLIVGSASNSMILPSTTMACIASGADHCAINGIPAIYSCMQYTTPYRIAKMVKSTYADDSTTQSSASALPCYPLVWCSTASDCYPTLNTAPGTTAASSICIPTDQVVPFAAMRCSVVQNNTGAFSYNSIGLLCSSLLQTIAAYPVSISQSSSSTTSTASTTTNSTSTSATSTSTASTSTATCAQQGCNNISSGRKMEFTFLWVVAVSVICSLIVGFPET